MSQAVSDASLVFRHILGDMCSVIVNTGGSVCQTVKGFLQNVTKAKIRDRYGTTEVCSNGTHVDLAFVCAKLVVYTPFCSASVCMLEIGNAVVFGTCFHVLGWISGYKW